MNVMMLSTLLWNSLLLRNSCNRTHVKRRHEKRRHTKAWVKIVQDEMTCEKSKRRERRIPWVGMLWRLLLLRRLTSRPWPTKVLFNYIYMQYRSSVLDWTILFEAQMIGRISCIMCFKLCIVWFSVVIAWKIWRHYVTNTVCCLRNLHK